MTATTSMNQPDQGTQEPTQAPSRQAIAERLLRLRDEVIVRNHLAGMEVKSAVHELGRELDKLAASFSRGVETVTKSAPHDARLRMYIALADSNARFLEMESAIKAALAGAARSATVVAETARLKAALARMDAESSLETRRQELTREMHLLEQLSGALLKELGHRLSKLSVETSKIV